MKFTTFKLTAALSTCFTNIFMFVTTWPITLFLTLYIILKTIKSPFYKLNRVHCCHIKPQRKELKLPPISVYIPYILLFVQELFCIFPHSNNQLYLSPTQYDTLPIGSSICGYSLSRHKHFLHDSFYPAYLSYKFMLLSPTLASP